MSVTPAKVRYEIKRELQRLKLSSLTNFRRTELEGIAGCSMKEFLSSLGSGDGCVGRNRFLSVGEKAGYDIFEGLDDPFKEIQFQVTRDGVRYWHTVSAAELLKIEHASYQQARHDLINVLDELHSAQIITYNHPEQFVQPNNPASYHGDWNAYGKLDRRLTSPNELLAWPQNPYEMNMARLKADMAPNMPHPKRANPVYLTNKAFKQSEFSDDAYISVCERILSSLEHLYRATNANPAFAPALFIPLAFPRVDQVGVHRPPYVVSPYLSDYQRNYQIRREWRKFWTMPNPGDSPDTCHFRITGITDNEVWMPSLRARHGNIVPGSRDGASTSGVPGVNHTVESDCMLDLAQLVETARFHVDTPPHVLFHSVTTFHNMLLHRAYENIPLAFGSDLADYENALTRERKASQKQAIANAGAVVEIGFYLAALTGSSEEHGDREEGRNLSGSTVATVPLAISLFVANPALGLAAVALLGIAGLVTWLLSGSTPHDPTQDFIRDKLTIEHWKDTNNFYGFTPANTIPSMPVLRYE